MSSANIPQTDLSGMSTGEVIDGLVVVGDGMVKCPICGRVLATSENPEISAIYTHFRSRKHNGMRPVAPDFDGAFRVAIKRICQAGRKRARERAAEEEKAGRRRQGAEAARRAATYDVTGAFLDDIAEGMEALVSFMEPYYLGTSAENEANAMIARIRAISKAPATGD